MAFHINNVGTWKPCTVWINNVGTWKKAAVWLNVSGVWKQITTLLSASLPASISAGDSVFAPNNAFAELYVSNSGGWGATNGGTGTWLTSGTNSEFQVRLTGTGDTPSGSALNTWITLSSNTNWSLSQNVQGFKTFNGTLEIRMSASPNTVLASSTIVIDVIKEI